MPKRSIVTAVLMTSLLSASVFGQQPQPDFSTIERVALEELKEKNTPGAAVAVVSGDRVVFAKGFGISNIETGAPVTPEMLFRIGSTTKMFTAAALVALADQGKLKLDEPIGHYVKGLNEKISQLTPHQLLSHTAGIKDEAPMYGAHDDSALGNGVRSWKDDHLFTEPGKIISYSNPGYWLAGFVIEQVGARPFADQMSHTLFKPLGMNSTTFRPTMAMTYPLSQGHDARGRDKPTIIRPMADNSASWPAGSMFTSVNDLSRFVIAFLNGGRIDGKQVLGSDVIAKLSTPYAKIPTSPQGGYGYGLMIGEQRGVQVIQHGGSRSGYGSIIIMAPEHRFGVIVLGNRSGVSLSKTADKAMELLLPLKAAVEESKKDLPMSEAEMARCVGIYVQGSTRFEIFIKDGKLFGKVGGSEGPITSNGNNRFSIMMGGAQTFALVPGADGKYEYFHRGLRAAKRVR